MKRLFMRFAACFLTSVFSGAGLAGSLDEYRAQTLSFDHESTSIAGTLYLPEGEGSFPVLLAVHGSGPADRTSFGYFELLAPRLLENGIAFFSYDKPGVNESGGDWLSMTLSDRARKNVAAAAFLKGLPEIDGTNIGLLGGSQGAWVAPMAANMDSSIAHVIAFSGPSISPRQQNIFVVENALRLAGHDQAVVQKGKAWAAEVMHAAADGREFEDVRVALLQPAADKPWGEILPLADARIWDYLRLTNSVSGKPDFDHDPLRELARLKTPMLAIFGEKDPLVPVAQSARMYEETFARSASTHAQVKVFEGADHVIRVGSDFAPSFTDLLVEWTRARGR